MSRHQSLYQILVKFNSTRLNYSDLKTENFGAVHHFVFDREWIFAIPRPPEPILHQRVKFQQNRQLRSWDIDKLFNHGLGVAI